MAQLSFIVPARKANHFSVFLWSLHHQTYKDFEVLCYLNGLDHELEVLEDVVGFWKKYLELKVVGIELRRGVSHVSRWRNLLFNESSADLIVVACDDMVYCPKAAELFVQDYNMYRYNNLVAISVSRYGRDGFNGPHTVHPVSHNVTLDDILRPTGGGGAVTRWAWEEAGGFDEGYKGYGYEDDDFWLKLRMLHGCVVVDTRISYFHIYHSSREIDEPYEYKAFLANQRRYMERWKSKPYELKIIKLE